MHGPKNAGKFKPGWQVLDHLAAEMTANSFEDVSYFEETKRHVYHVFHEMVRRGELLSHHDATFGTRYRTAAGKQLAESHMDREPVEAQAMQ